MASPARFLFDNDFTAVERTKASITPTDLAAKLADAETAGYRNGMAAAKAQADQRAAATFERIVAALDELNRGLATIEARLAAEAVAVAVAVGKKLAPELMAREPLAEISALAADCFRHLVAAPHVVVRVNDTLHGQAREALEQAARGCDSRLVVLAEPDIAPGDCRIEWADGGVKRDRAAVEAAIDEAAARYVAGRDGETYMPAVSWNGQQSNGGGESQLAGASGPSPDGARAMPDVSWSKQQ